MLTITYSLAVLSAERRDLHRRIERFERSLDELRMSTHEDITLGTLEKISEELSAFGKRFHDRKLHRHLVPALRKARCGASAAIKAIDALGDESTRLLHYVFQQCRRGLRGLSINARRLILELEEYCRRVRECLKLEEASLIPVAIERLPEEEWIGVAGKLLDECTSKRRGCRQSASLGWKGSRLQPAHIH